MKGTVEEMILYGTHATYFLMGVVCTLLVMIVVLAVASAVLERKRKRMQDELDKMLRGE